MNELHKITPIGLIIVIIICIITYFCIVLITKYIHKKMEKFKYQIKSIFK